MPDPTNTEIAAALDELGDLYELDGAVILPYVEVGRGARLRNVIVDSDVRVPPGLVVGEEPDLDARRFRRTEKGVCLITQAMLDRLG